MENHLKGSVQPNDIVVDYKNQGKHSLNHAKQLAYKQPYWIFTRNSHTSLGVKVTYTFKSWSDRISERTDLSTSVVHLTKEGEHGKSINTLFKILSEKRILGSTTESGFIVGETPAVCFQDAPLTSIAQNCWFEQKLREANNSIKVRYTPCGLMFKKPFIYRKGGRPVIYEETNMAKDILPRNQWWRIVNFDFNNKESIIDWSHEREWRIPNELEFDYDDVCLLFISGSAIKKFIEICDAQGEEIYKKVDGIISLEKILY